VSRHMWRRIRLSSGRLFLLSRYYPGLPVEKLGGGEYLNIPARVEAQQGAIPGDNVSCLSRDRAFQNPVIVRVAAIGNPFSGFNNGTEPFKALPNLCDLFSRVFETLA